MATGDVIFEFDSLVIPEQGVEPYEASYRDATYIYTRKFVTFNQNGATVPVEDYKVKAVARIELEKYAQSKLNGTYPLAVGGVSELNIDPNKRYKLTITEV